MRPSWPEVICEYRPVAELVPIDVERLPPEQRLDRLAAAGEVSIPKATRSSWKEDLGELRVVEVRQATVDHASELVWRRSLRADDALQLATALRLGDATGRHASLFYPSSGTR